MLFTQERKSIYYLFWYGAKDEVLVQFAKLNILFLDQQHINEKED